MRKSVLAFACLMLAASVCEAANKQDRVLLAFKDQTCGACKEMEPVLKKLERKGYVVIRIDVDTAKGRKLAREYKVKELPTFVVLDKTGREQARETGVVSEGVLLIALKVVKLIVFGVLRLIL
jgi:thiol-disulfide isomerase/thioredoxin